MFGSEPDDCQVLRNGVCMIVHVIYDRRRKEKALFRSAPESDTRRVRMLRVR